MADINQVQLPDGSQYNITDTTSGYATQAYVQNAISGITKATIGLGNVDNTSDANKPVSTAQQTALDAKTNTSVIAYTEASTTATKRYEIGDQFILSGVLYTATAIIANGGTITVGTNCTASDTIIEQLANIGGSADNITFDNTGTDLVSENVEDAIKEVNEKTKHGIVELWKNDSPSANFAGQQITFTSSYTLDALIVVYGVATGGGRGDEWYEIDSDFFGTSAHLYERAFINGNNVSFSTRTISDITVSGSSISITFSDAQIVTMASTAQRTTDNSRAVPMKVLGLIHNN